MIITAMMEITALLAKPSKMWAAGTTPVAPTRTMMRRAATSTRTCRFLRSGDRYLRTLLVHGARAALTAAGRRTDRRSRWALATRERRGWNIAAVALANKNARTAWAVLACGAQFDAAHVGKAA